MQNIRLGIIGWGGRGGAVARMASLASGGVMQAAACIEPSDDRYQRGCSEFDAQPIRFSTISEMCSEGDLDGVILASPNGFHLSQLLELEDFGLPILLEKPLDATFDKICEVVNFSRHYSAPILVGHCMRFAPILRAAKSILERGDIGRICSTRFVQNCHYGNGGYHNWRRRKESSGTWFIEKATHDFDIMNWFVDAAPVSMAAVSRLQAFGGTKPADLRCRNCEEKRSCPESISNLGFRNGIRLVEEHSRMDDLCVFSSEVDTPDNEVALVQYDNGVFGTYHQWFFSPRSYHHRIYEIQGTLGAMEVDLGGERGGKISVSLRFGEPDSRAVHYFDYLNRNHYNADGAMALHFCDVIQGKAEPQATVEQAFTAELMGHGAVLASDARSFVSLGDLVPEFLSSPNSTRSRLCEAMI